MDSSPVKEYCEKMFNFGRHYRSILNNVKPINTIIHVQNVGTHFYGITVP